MKINQLRQQVDEMKDQFETDKASQLNQSRFEEEQESILVKNHQSQIDKLNEEIKSYKLKISDLEKKLSDAENKASLNALSDKLIEAKNEEIDDLNAQISEFKMLQEDNLRKMGELEQTIVQQKATVNNKDDLMDKLREKDEIIDDLEKQIEDLKQENKTNEENANKKIEFLSEDFEKKFKLFESQIDHLENDKNLLYNENENLVILKMK